MNKILCKSYHMTVLSIWNGIFFWNANLDSLEIILSLPIQDLYCSHLFTEFKLINQCSIGDYKTFIAVLSLIAFLCALCRLLTPVQFVKLWTWHFEVIIFSTSTFKSFRRLEVVIFLFCYSRNPCLFLKLQSEIDYVYFFLTYKAWWCSCKIICCIWSYPFFQYSNFVIVAVGGI